MCISEVTKRISLYASLMFVCSLFTTSVFAQGNSGNANGQPFAALQAQIDELKGLVDALTLGTPVEVTVDCGAGESIVAALTSVPVFLPIRITIEGLCNEPVFIVRDDVVLQGATPSDGFAGGNGPAAIFGANRIFINNMTIDATGATWGVGCFQGSVININNVAITGGGFGIFAVDGGQCRGINTNVDGSGTGIFSMQDSLVDMEGAFTISNAGMGVRASQGGNVRLQGGLVTGNGTGVQSSEGSHISLSGSSVNNNFGDGVRVSWGASLRTEISFSASDNGGNGMTVENNSTLIGFGVITIANNGNWGIQCTADSALVNGAGTYSGNGAGDIDCP